MRVLKERTFTGTTDPNPSQRELNNRKLARRAAGEGMVLLKNDNGLLPLDPAKPVALYGAGAANTIKGGTGSGDVNNRDSVSIYKGMENAGFTLTTKAWLEDYLDLYQKARFAWRDDIVSRAGAASDMGPGGFFDVYATTPFFVPAGSPITGNTDAEVAIYCIGRIAGEGADRFDIKGDYYINDQEEAHLKAICSMYKDVVLVVNAGAQIDLSFADAYENISAIVYIVQPGMEGGNAFADVITGRVTPSGKLTDTWTNAYSDYPYGEEFSHLNGDVTKDYYKQDIYVGYRYFDTCQAPVRYGFGFGLSYTTFETRVLGAALDTGDKGGILVTLETTNTGSTYAGREVIQLYATCPIGDLEKEYRRLAAFKKTRLLAPGEKEQLTLTIPFDALTSYSEAAPGWMLESGPYVIWAGNSLMSSTPACVVYLDEDVLLTRTINICPLQEELVTLDPSDITTGERMDALMQQVEAMGLPTLELKGEELSCTVIDYKPNAQLYSPEAMAFVDSCDMEDVIAMATGEPSKGQGSNLGSAGISVPGSAAETSQALYKAGLGSIVLSDGPAGLRLNKNYDVLNGEIVALPFESSIEGGLFYPAPEKDPAAIRYYQYCTAIPVGALLAQTWDEQLVEEIGEMIGGELQEFNTTLWLAPGMNIHKNPLCGRNFEYYSEDPFVTGRIAAAMTRGVQRVPGVGTTIKHFACNNQEDNRMGVDAVISERALREIYLKGFEIAIKEAQPMAIMTSYNLLNGIHTANNYDLCTNAARNEWGFKGLIMTDWTTTHNGPDCTAAGCMRAGNDLVMPGRFEDQDCIREEMAAGTLDEGDLKACIARVVDIIWQSIAYEDAKPYNP